jgi:hypothetical protein
MPLHVHSLFAGSHPVPPGKLYNRFESEQAFEITRDTRSRARHMTRCSLGEEIQPRFCLYFASTVSQPMPEPPGNQPGKLPENSDDDPASYHQFPDG